MLRESECWRCGKGSGGDWAAATSVWSRGSSGLGSTTASVCSASFGDAEQVAAGTMCTRALKGALVEYRGIMARARLAL